VLSLSTLPLLRTLALLIALAGPEGAPPAPVPPSEDSVERHAALGQRHLEHGRYQDAIAEFRRAYELRAEPRLLLGIAEAYRLYGIVERALFFYQRYLAAIPEDAPDRADVEQKMSELEQARQRTAAPAAPAPRLDNDVLIVPVAAAPPVAQRPGRRAPLWHRWWFWTALGAVAAAGAITAAAALSRGSQTQVPSTDLGDRRFY
jgi:tetratricopeptide (TPR) repeat protein